MNRWMASLGAVLFSCGGNTLDVGSQDAGTSADGPPVVVGKPGPTGESCENGPQLPIVGTWNGYVENKTWVTGSDAVHLSVTNANDTLLCGTITLGDSPPPPPVTDGRLSYPPGRFVKSQLLPGFDGMGMLSIYAEGFVIPIENAKVVGSRLEFNANWALPWKPWCELQTPELQSDIVFRCPLQGDDPECFDGTMTTNCGRNVLCWGICSCTETTCTAGEQPCDHLNFDLRVAGSEATGSVKLGCSDTYNVHLERAP